MVAEKEVRSRQFRGPESLGTECPSSVTPRYGVDFLMKRTLSLGPACMEERAMATMPPAGNKKVSRKFTGTLPLLFGDFSL